MTTIFSRIIDGELPAGSCGGTTGSWRFLPIAAPGRRATPSWCRSSRSTTGSTSTDDLNAHLWSVAKAIGGALQEAFQPSRVGVLVVGEEVPHTHVHLVPFTELVADELRQPGHRAPTPPRSTSRWSASAPRSAPHGHGAQRARPEALARPSTVERRPASAPGSASSVSSGPSLRTLFTCVETGRRVISAGGAGTRSLPSSSRSCTSRSSQVSQASGGRITGIRSWMVAIDLVGRGRDDRAGPQRLVVPVGALPDLPEPGERVGLAVGPRG